jgi:hypothetical protein
MNIAEEKLQEYSRGKVTRAETIRYFTSSTTLFTRLKKTR